MRISFLLSVVAMEGDRIKTIMSSGSVAGQGYLGNAMLKHMDNLVGIILYLSKDFCNEK